MISMVDKIDQKVGGSGNAFSGSGPVTINNITKNYYSSEEPCSTTKALSELAPLFGVPNLPPRYLERPEYLDSFREALLSGETEAVGITGRSQYIGVQGMGGLGKSVLAGALAWDEEVRRAFPDGIFWLRFGQEVDEAGVLELQKEILLVLAPDGLPESPAQGRNLLNLALQGKRCLLIADDLWESRHINHFDLADSGSRFLLTTRNNEVIQETGARRCELELLSDEQARELLAKCSGFAEEDLPEEAEAILRECNRLPLAVAAIGSMVNGKGRSRWQLALKKLQNARLDKIPAKFDRYYGYENLFKVFQVSVEDLPEKVQTYFKTLVVFAEDTKIPEAVLQLFWEHIGDGEYEPLEAVDLLVQRSLLTPAGEESFTLHDLLRDYLVFQTDGEVAELHRQLLAAYKVKYPGGWYMIPYDEEYFDINWIYHARLSSDLTQATDIADSLIRNQPLLSLDELMEALKFVNYDLEEIASHLLKINQESEVICLCLQIVPKDEAEKTARCLLKFTEDHEVISECLRILPDEEAKKEARNLLRSSEDYAVIDVCFKMLPDNEAQKEAKSLLKSSKNEIVLSICLKLLGRAADEEARNFLKQRAGYFLAGTCLDLLRYDGKEECRYWLKKEREERSTSCRLDFIPKIGPFYENVIAKCLKILGDDAKEEARYWLMRGRGQLQVNCLNILGEDAKEEARHILGINRHPRVIIACLVILKGEAKEEARSLITSKKNEKVLMACCLILGREAEDVVTRLAQTARNKFVREKSQSILSGWNKNIATTRQQTPSAFP
jgi:hypothetical protein